MIALRETYLEMTPLVEIKGESNVFKCRIGDVPLDLDNLGVDLSPGEISEEVVEYITIRLQLKSELEQGRKKLEEENLEKINSVNEGTEILRRENGELGSSPSISSSIVPYSLENDFINGSSGDILCYFGLKCQFNSENSNIPKAIYWYTKAAEHEHLLSLFILKYCYSTGFVVEKDFRNVQALASKIERHLKTHEIGIEKNEYQDQDNNLSFKLLEQMVNHTQNQVLQYLMGMCYFFGLGVKKCEKRAVEWYQLAADQGDVVAQTTFGVCCKKGSGVEMNDGEALKWYRLAAEQGYAAAQDNIGNWYYVGYGVERCYGEAVKWYRLAAEQGYCPAQHSLGVCYADGKGVEKSYEEAVKWYRLAAEQGHAIAQNRLGCCYLDGEGVQKSAKEAVKWFRLAADQGYAGARCYLGFCYMVGRGVDKNRPKALKWYRLAADQGDADAQYQLGCCYHHGIGVRKVFKEAVRWYQLAADQGHAESQCCLGEWFFDGKGVEKNVEEAVKWYRKAADQGIVRAQKFLVAIGRLQIQKRKEHDDSDDTNRKKPKLDQ